MSQKHDYEIRLAKFKIYDGLNKKRSKFVIWCHVFGMEETLDIMVPQKYQLRGDSLLPL